MRDFNLFPIPQNLLTLERKYGDSLNFEDINGFRQKKRKRTRERESTIDDGMTETQMQSEWGKTTVVSDN